MIRPRSTSASLLCLPLLTLFANCDGGADKAPDRLIGGGEGGVAAGGAHSGGSAGASSAVVDSGGGSGAGTAGGSNCGGDFHEAEPAPLSLYFMVDQSGSMGAQVQGGGTKWDAINTALGSFLTGSGVQELYAALQVFPYFRPSAASCGVEADCNGFGPCLTPKACTNDTGLSCTKDEDCRKSADDTGLCWDRGYCSGYENSVCVETAEFPAICRVDGGVQDCLLVPRECAGYQSCDAADYANPVVAMAPQATSGPAILAALGATTPTGATPTGPALSGAIDYAASWRGANLDHKVAAVLVTDGMPVGCSPTAIDDIAAIAAAGVATVPTYVIGVFEEALAQDAQTNLDKLAQAGGTDSAFIVSTSSNVAQEIAAALASVQESRIACEYKIPEPTVGTFVANRVNVDYKQGGAESERALYVGTLADCDNVEHGWYYDVVPGELGAEPTPSLILLCPQTCALVQGDDEAAISIQLGCPTEIPL